MRKDKTPNYISVGIFTVITTVSWIFFSAYRILTSKATPTLSNEALASFNPNLDETEINKMEQRIFFEEGETQAVVSETPIPTPTPEVTPTSTPAPTQEGQQATPPGEVTQ